ncbi:resolvase [Bacillus sp. BGMRC 2118]|nr:resolvase [Bacillus sp. BGMRC 2118]
MKTVAYYRRSTNIQENSIEMQRQLARNLSYQKALIINEEFIDDAVSGRKKSIKEREGLSTLLSKIKEDNVKNLFVYKRDRLARNALEYLEIFQLLKEKNIQVIFTAENELPLQYSPAGELIELLMAGIIQREGEQIVERISETIKANFQRGKTPGNLPYGYRYDKNSKTVIREEHKLDFVKTIFELVISKEHTSLKEITSFINNNDFENKDMQWTSQMIKNIISNPTYMGIRILNISGEVLKGKYDILAIVNEKEWTLAQEVLESLTIKRRKSKKVKVQYHLENLAFCKECNQPLKTKTGKTNKMEAYYYSCSTHKIKVEKDSIEKQVMSACIDYFKELQKTHLPQLFIRQISRANEQLNRILLENNQNLSKLNKKLENKTGKWINEKRQYEKEKQESDLLNLYEQIEIQQQYTKTLEDKIIENEQSLDDIKHDKYGIIDLEYTPSKELFQDIISKILLDQHTVHLVFKHPFFTTKEMIESDAS